MNKIAIFDQIRHFLLANHVDPQIVSLVTAAIGGFMGRHIGGGVLGMHRRRRRRRQSGDY